MSGSRLVSLPLPTQVNDGCLAWGGRDGHSRTVYYKRSCRPQRRLELSSSTKKTARIDPRSLPASSVQTKSIKELKGQDCKSKCLTGGISVLLASRLCRLYHIIEKVSAFVSKKESLASWTGAVLNFI